MAVYPPHPEEGASRCAFPETQAPRSARLEGWAAPWFETPRTRLRNPGRPKIAAPHHEGREEPRSESALASNQDLKGGNHEICTHAHACRQHRARNLAGGRR